MLAPHKFEAIVDANREKAVARDDARIEEIMNKISEAIKKGSTTLKTEFKLQVYDIYDLQRIVRNEMNAYGYAVTVESVGYCNDVRFKWKTAAGKFERFCFENSQFAPILVWIPVFLFIGTAIFLFTCEDQRQKEKEIERTRFRQLIDGRQQIRQERLK